LYRLIFIADATVVPLNPRLNIVNPNSTIATGALDEIVYSIAYGNGIWLAVWDRSFQRNSSSLGSFSSTLSSTSSSVNWTYPIPIDRNFTPGWTLKFPFVIFSNGTFICVWQRKISSSVEGVYSSRTTDGTQWELPSPVLAGINAGFDIPPALAANNNGTIIVIWEVSVYVYNLSKSIDNGQSWSKLPQFDLRSNGAFSTGSQTFQLSYCMNSYLFVFAAFNQSTSTENDIYSSISTDGINWSLFSAVNSYALNDTGNDDYPSIACNGTHWLVAWEGALDLDSNINPNFNTVSAYGTSTDGRAWSTSKVYDPQSAYAAPGTFPPNSGDSNPIPFVFPDGTWAIAFVFGYPTGPLKFVISNDLVNWSNATVIYDPTTGSPVTELTNPKGAFDGSLLFPFHYFFLSDG
jgi:hypothetical protein